MPVAYLTSSQTTLRKQGRRLIAESHDRQLASFGMSHLESVVLKGSIQVTTSALRAMLRNRIQACFLSSNGRLLGHLSPARSGDIELRLAQYQLHADELAKLTFASQCVQAKVEAMLEVIDRYSANYSDARLGTTRQKLRTVLTTTRNATSLPQLLGIEGQASASYWSCFDCLNRSELGFFGRSRRPPRDPVNALLSLGYTLLANELNALTEALGFDPYLGFYHTPKNHRPALALDVIEPFRHVLIDRLVLRLINLGRIRLCHMTGDEATGFSLDAQGWKIFLSQYEETMIGPPAGIMKELYPQAESWRDLLLKHCLMLRRSFLQIKPYPAPEARRSEQGAE